MIGTYLILALILGLFIVLSYIDKKVNGKGGYWSKSKRRERKQKEQQIKTVPEAEAAEQC